MSLRHYAPMLVALLACDSSPTPTAPPVGGSPPPSATVAISVETAIPVTLLEPSTPIDERFTECAGACGAKVAYQRGDVVIQPGATTSDLAYCPVSGAVFAVKASSPTRIIAGETLFFCCAACAKYFSEHAERVLAARSIAVGS